MRAQMEERFKEEEEDDIYVLIEFLRGVVWESQSSIALSEPQGAYL